MLTIFKKILKVLNPKYKGRKFKKEVLIQVFSKCVDVARKIKRKFEFPKKLIIRLWLSIRSAYSKDAQERKDYHVLSKMVFLQKFVRDSTAFAVYLTRIRKLHYPRPIAVSFIRNSRLASRPAV